MTTWDPSAKGASIVLSNGNLTATFPSGSFGSVKSTTGHTSGFYFEVTFSSVVTGGGAASSIGFANSSANMSSYLSADVNSIGWNCNGGCGWNNTAQFSSAGYAAGDVVGALIGSGNIKFYKNGTLMGTSTNFPTGTLFAGATLGNATDAETANFGSVSFLPAGATAWDAVAATPFIFPRNRHYIRR